ncbi:ATP-binding protein [Actinomadura viridis]|uniref:Anti-sigma regulatory factor (Ser/Thr protein kinase) n=1 Tax=Actinomadura viridis TaxID=58110 RepID=A0A931DAB9_9ACTN|nr:ATP-binding protein [Actinomadura viridis]MBG6086515.1 anti-sigma regulatory factor (Ser/Thr protein kinase) [Actinomadura viridis]
MVWSQTYPGHKVMVPAARAFVRAMLNGVPRTDDAELVAAELVANSLRHTPSGQAGGSFEVSVSVRRGWARIAVSDEGAGDWRPCADRPADDEEYGRGLLIIEAYADKVGHDVGGRGQTMWAEFTWPDEDASWWGP